MTMPRPASMLVMLATALIACAHSDPAPESTVRAYLDAIEHRQFDRAFAMLSSTYRDGHSPADLERAMTRADASAAKKSLARARVERSCELELPNGERIRLVVDKGQWRLADNPLEWFPQATPKEALTSFLRALERERYDVALRFVPSTYRVKLSEAVLKQRWQGEQRTTLLAQLREARAHLHEPFELDGEDRALLPLGGNKAARVVREARAWKVESLE